MYIPKITTDSERSKNMIVNYNVKRKERKLLAQTIGKAIGVDAIYKGVPTCAYEIDAIAAAGFEPQDSGEKCKGIAIQMPMMTGDEISRL